jgi:hypothetical protein
MNSDPWVICTASVSPAHWQEVRSQIAEPQTDDQLLAWVQYVHDCRFFGKTIGDVIRMLPDDYPNSFCFIVDGQTFASDEHSIVVVSFLPEWDDNRGEFNWQSPRQILDDQIKHFRAQPRAIQSIQNNLSLGNMDFEDFANHLDGDGIYRS